MSVLVLLQMLSFVSMEAPVVVQDETQVKLSKYMAPLVAEQVMHEFGSL